VNLKAKMHLYRCSPLCNPFSIGVPELHRKIRTGGKNSAKELSDASAACGRKGSPQIWQLSQITKKAQTGN